MREYSSVNVGYPVPLELRRKTGGRGHEKPAQGQAQRFAKYLSIRGQEDVHVVGKGLKEQIMVRPFRGTRDGVDVV